MPDKCRLCGGTGEVPTPKCELCRDTGYVSEAGCDGWHGWFTQTPCPNGCPGALVTYGTATHIGDWTHFTFSA